MPLLEQDYCVEQINVPPKLPMILKQFCKSAIRTQPYDLLKWSSAYFRALANGEEPPTKLRLEYPPACSQYGLTLGFLKVLLRQLGADYNKVITLDKILERWDYLCLDRRDSNLIIEIGRFRCKCQIKKFLSIAVGLLTCSLTETMIMVCELFTHEPDGGSAMIPVSLFMEIYGYLASLRCDGCEKGGTLDLCISSDATTATTAPSMRIEPQQEDDEEAPDAMMAGPVSVASQDTEADIDLDLESFAKEDEQSATTLQSFGDEMEESYLHEGEASFRSTDRSGSAKSRGSMYEGDEEKEEEEAAVESTSETIKEIPVAKSVSVASKKSQPAPATTAADAATVTAAATATSESTQQSSDKCECDSLPNYPDVPGIGRRLLAEEVATVAIWMSECARRQGGMIGPRNVRHINCPPLEGNCCGSRSRSRDDLLMDK